MNLIGNNKNKRVSLYGKVKNGLRYLFVPRKRRVWLRSYRIWQHRPHQVAAMSQQSHQCASCGTQFTGNFCPRCGQSYKVGRFSFSNALLLFLDVWGVGNRSMFRTVRDMMFRPGYMIRDYLRGMQSAYFPPFEMFFLFATAYLLVEHGFLPENEAVDDAEKAPVEVVMGAEDTLRHVDGVLASQNLFGGEVSEPSDSLTTAEDALQASDEPKSKPKKVFDLHHNKYFTMIQAIVDSNESLFNLLALILFSVPMFFFFRTTPQIEKLRFSEFIVALIYTANTFSIFFLASKLLDIGLLKWLAILMVFITLKQLTGYSKRRVFGYLLLTTLISSIAFLIILIVLCYFIYKSM
ncbi:MAG: DUF3667 domain-containing protein [Bacteroidales bacterium]|nr:DUF3667 domain-containing protein [Bacteroidales bacterium]